MKNSTITGWGMALPETVVTNSDLEARLDTSDSWITERTGIKERRIGGTTIELAIQAGAQALKSASDRSGEILSRIDVLIVSTNTPDPPVPATAAYVQDALSLECGVFDLNSGCSGFIYALVAANGFIATGMDRVLVIASDTVSKIVDQNDRGTAILFGDGAGACLVESKESIIRDTYRDGTASANNKVEFQSDILAWDLGSDGYASKFLYRNHNSFVVMDGREVFKRAVRATAESAKKALARARLDANQINWFIPHQANLRIIEAVGERINIPIDRTIITIDRTGNISSASIPLALAEAAEQGRLHPGDLLLMSGFGAGLTWGSVIVRWNGSEIDF
jgi:3-oxoacyl-[acyl-carrier-protein] synthase-3